MPLVHREEPSATLPARGRSNSCGVRCRRGRSIRRRAVPRAGRIRRPVRLLPAHTRQIETKQTAVTTIMRAQAVAAAYDFNDGQRSLITFSRLLDRSCDPTFRNNRLWLSFKMQHTRTDPDDTPNVFVEEIATADESSNETSCRKSSSRGPTMWLDVTLGGIILIAAFRGWFRGFVSQAVWIAGLVACVYVAEPVRNYAKPHVLPYLPKIPPELVDRILWWVSAVVSLVVLVGVASLIIKMTRRPEIPGIARRAATTSSQDSC